MNEKFKSNWPAPDEHMLEVGRLMTIWGSLETLVLFAISKFAGFDGKMDRRAVIMVNHSNMRQKIDIIGALCEQLVEEYPQLDSYKGVVTKLKSAQKARNKFAHNSLCENEETGKVETCYFSSRGTLKTKVEVVGLKDIRDATARVHIASCALHSLVMGKELKPYWER